MMLFPGQFSGRKRDSPKAGSTAACPLSCHMGPCAQKAPGLAEPALLLPSWNLLSCLKARSRVFTHTHQAADPISREARGLWAFPWSDSSVLTRTQQTFPESKYVRVCRSYKLSRDESTLLLGRESNRKQSINTWMNVAMF